MTKLTKNLRITRKGKDDITISKGTVITASLVDDKQVLAYVENDTIQQVVVAAPGSKSVKKHLLKMTDAEVFYAYMFIASADMEHLLEVRSEYSRKALAGVFKDPKLAVSFHKAVDSAMKAGPYGMNFVGTSKMKDEGTNELKRRFKVEIVDEGSIADLYKALLALAKRNKIALDMDFVKRMRKDSNKLDKEMGEV